MQFKWTDELKTRAEELYSSGLSCRAVAAEIGGGVSRCAIQGIVHRRKAARGEVTRLPPTDPRLVIPKTDPLARKRQVASTSKPSSSVAPAVVHRTAPSFPAPRASAGGFLLEHLGSRCCKWPITPDHVREHLFCGAPRPDGRNYCEEHQAIAVRPTSGAPMRPQAIWDKAIVRKAS
jgi:GcrA cell cycle regulator